MPFENVRTLPGGGGFQYLICTECRAMIPHSSVEAQFKAQTSAQVHESWHTALKTCLTKNANEIYNLQMIVGPEK